MIPRQHKELGDWSGLVDLVTSRIPDFLASVYAQDWYPGKLAVEFVRQGLIPRAADFMNYVFELADSGVPILGEYLDSLFQWAPDATAAERALAIARGATLGFRDLMKLKITQRIVAGALSNAGVPPQASKAGLALAVEGWTKYYNWAFDGDSELKRAYNTSEAAFNSEIERRVNDARKTFELADIEPPPMDPAAIAAEYLGEPPPTPEPLGRGVDMGRPRRPQRGAPREPTPPRTPGRRQREFFPLDPSAPTPAGAEGVPLELGGERGREGPLPGGAGFPVGEPEPPVGEPEPPAIEPEPPAIEPARAPGGLGAILILFATIALAIGVVR
jgi:hypothetical protein